MYTFTFVAEINCRLNESFKEKASLSKHANLGSVSEPNINWNV